MEKVLPQLVYTELEAKAILYEDVIAILVEAMKEQGVALEGLVRQYEQEKLELESRLEQRDLDFNALMARLEALEKNSAN